MVSTPRDLDRYVELAAQAHQELLVALDGVEVDVSSPSRLPGWTRGHVLTHLARNADSHRRMFDAALAGTVADQYEDGADGRARDIEAGAGRPFEEQLVDVRSTIWALEGAWATTDWTGEGRLSRGALIAVTELPFRRLREVFVHHVDLDIGYELEGLPAVYVRMELRRLEMAWRASRPMGMTPLPQAALEAPPHLRLGWLMGRAEIDGLGPANVF